MTEFDGLMLNSPGIRYPWSENKGDDQVRFLTAGQAIASGISRVVVGRPILNAKPNGDSSRPQNRRQALDWIIVETGIRRGCGNDIAILNFSNVKMKTSASSSAVVISTTAAIVLFPHGASPEFVALAGLPDDHFPAAIGTFTILKLSHNDL